MVMHRRQVNSRFRNDLAKRSGGVPVLPDEPLGGVENLVLGVAHSYDSIN